MKKRILSLILACTVLMPASAGAFSTEDAPTPEWIVDETQGSAGMTDEAYSHIYGLLKYMGCVDTAAESLDPDEPITRAEAVATMAKIKGNVSPAVTEEAFSDVKKTDEYAAEIYSALKSGLIDNASGRFYPKKYITLDDCAAVALRILGYGAVPSEYRAGYIDELKLLKNVREDSKGLTRGNFYIFLENMLSASTAKVSITEGGAAYELDMSDNSYLLEYKSIAVYTGLITATEYSAIYNKKDFAEGCIEINNKRMKAENKISESMLGKYVTAYVDIEDEKNIVIAASADEKYNEETEFSFADYDDFSGNKISCFSDGKTKRIKLSENAIFVYNGQFGGDISRAEEYFADFDAARALDNNRDGEADVIFVDKRQYAYIESASDISQSMRTGLGEYIDLDEDVCASYRIFNEKGEQIDLTGVAPGSVIEYRLAYSYDKKAIYEILISKEKLVGVLKGTDTDRGRRYYDIDGTEYELSGYYEQYLAEDIKDKKPQIGNEATFYLSADGKIVFSSTNAYSYGFVIKGYCDTDDNDACHITMYTYDGAMKSYDFNEKIKLITPEESGGKRVEAKAAIEVLNDGTGSLKNEVIAFQTDSEGKIKLVATEMDMTGKAPGTVDYPLVKNHVVQTTDKASARRIYQELIGFTWYTPSSVKRMTVPTDKSKLEDSKYFSIGQVKGQGGDNNEYLLYEHVLYNSDEFYNVGFCLTKENKIALSSNIIEPYLVTKVSAAINDEDEEGVTVEYLSKKGKGSAFIKYDTATVTHTNSWMPKATVSELRAGDVIQFEKDSTGEVSILSVVIKSNALPNRGAYGSDGVTNDNGYFNPFESLGILHGTVEKTQASTESVLINLSADGKDQKGSMIFRVGKHGVGFYDYNVYLRDGKSYSAATFNDIMPGDEVIGIKRYNRVTDVYILR